jgi:hypothetical protein
MIAPVTDNAAILFLDLQDEILKNSGTVSAKQLKRTAGVLARLAVLHKLPAFLSAVPPGGAFTDSVLEALPGAEPRMRTETTAFADHGLVDALHASGRRLLILSGVASEIVVQRTALDALREGFEVQVLVDACGGVDARTEDAAWRRIVQAGGVTSSVVTFAAELTGDFTTPTGGATLGLAYEAMGA